MELRELIAFTKVVETGSFTQAAEERHTSKARLSKLVSQLEEKLGVRLLERTTRALSLTEVGRDIYQRATQILEQIEDTKVAAQISKGKPSGTLRLTCGVEFGMIAVSNWIDNYMERYPEVRVEADFTARKVEIVKEGYDIAIRVGRPEDSTLAIRRLGQLAYGMFAAPTYLAQQGYPENPHGLARHRLLVFSGGGHGRGWRLIHKSANQEEVTFKPKPWLRVNNSFAVANSAAKGLGIAVLPFVVAAPKLVDRQLVHILPEWQTEPVDVFALFADKRNLLPKVRAFLDLAIADAKRLGDLKAWPVDVETNDK